MTRIWRMNADKTLKASDYLFDPCHPCSFCFSTHLVFWNSDSARAGRIWRMNADKTLKISDYLFNPRSFTFCCS